MDINKLVDEVIVPAHREGRVVFTNGGQWIVKLPGCDIETLSVDITAYPEPTVEVIDGRTYARQWGMTFPLQTRAAEPEFSNWLS